jgi:hypothetical protein|tara:strand:- start:2464 stop:3321 length:858 start_codon:yes stop_codon:yes gene_type:complete
MKPILSEFYGDNTRWFIATVVDASPPHGFEGRVKIRVHGLHTESTRLIPQADLPWAQCVVPTTEGGASGIGRMPQLQPSALVFGMFMDGVNSQTPIVLGSLPHVEFPTTVQLGQIEEDVVSDNKPEGLWDKITDTFKPKVTDIQNEETGDISSLVKTARENTAVKFFLNVGYTEKQAIGITAGLSKVSGMITGITPRSKGIGAYNDRRYNDLLRFSNDSNEFLTQLSFVAYELNGTQSSANIRLLQSDRLDNNGICHIVGKYYLGRASIVKQIELTARRLTDRIV